MEFQNDYLDNYQEPYIEPNEDIFLGDFLVEFIHEAFWCNGEMITHEKMLSKVDFYKEVIDNLKDYKKEDLEPINVPIFNMDVSIFDFDEMFVKFENTKRL